MTRLIEDYNPICVAMAGVCAGRQNKTHLGDVIAAERLFFDDTGKELDTRVQQDIKTYNLRGDWKVAIEHFKFRERFEKKEWLKKRPIPYEWQQNWVLAKLREGTLEPWKDPQYNDFCPQWRQVIRQLFDLNYVHQTQKGELHITEEGRIRINRVLLDYAQKIPDLSPFGNTLLFDVHVAPMGSGNKVIENKDAWGFISEFMRKTLSIEMEAAAIGAVAEAFVDRRLDKLVMKGVMDFANHGRDDHFKEFAARAAAECLIAFLREKVDPRAIPEDSVDANQYPKIRLQRILRVSFP